LLIQLIIKKQLNLAKNIKKPTTSFSAEVPLRQERLLFPIVGIGASAGGLEAELREEIARLKKLLD